MNNFAANVQKKLMVNGRIINYKQDSPFISGYNPKINTPP